MQKLRRQLSKDQNNHKQACFYCCFKSTSVFVDLNLCRTTSGGQQKTQKSVQMMQVSGLIPLHSFYIAIEAPFNVATVFDNISLHQRLI